MLSPTTTRRATLAIIATTAMIALASARPAQATTALHAPFDGLLAKYVKLGADQIARVDYATWHKNGGDRKVLDEYIRNASATKPSTLPRNEQFAYWANLYNALTLKVILDAYPVKSIRDIKSEAWLDPKAWLGPWRTERVTVEGKRLSLDNIEHDIMRPTYNDPRVHYSVNCASIGCPNLMPRAWKAETLDADLDAAARAYINHPRGVEIEPDGSAKISSIYRWFQADFGGTDQSVIAHFKKFASSELKAKLEKATKLGTDHYDWTLNETR